jgi:hypothetical protein
VADSGIICTGTANRSAELRSEVRNSQTSGKIVMMTVATNTAYRAARPIATFRRRERTAALTHGRGKA